MRTKSVTIWAMTAVLFITAGQVFGVMYLQDGGTWNISVHIPDGVCVDLIAPSNPTTVNLLEGGDSHLTACNDSRINIYGGNCSGLLAYNNSQVTKTGGSMGSLDAWGNSQVTITGGFLYGLYASDNSRVNWSGGPIGGNNILLGGQAILTIVGHNFAVDGSPFGYGEITSMFGGNYDNEPYRQLTGALANGDIINNTFRIGQTAKIVLVPEPATLLLLGLGAGMLRRKH